MKQKLYLFIMGFLVQAGLFAQSIPNISYAPQKFSIGTAVSLTPTNTGGAMTYGLLSTLAGDGSYGDVDGPGNSASFNGLMGVAVDALGNVYVVDIQNQKIKKITPGGNVSTFAGSGLDGIDDGNGSDASFSYPIALAVDALAYVYVIDNNSHKIRKISPERDVSTFIGIGFYDYDSNGNPTTFLNPNGIAVDADGNVYIADTSNNQIKKFTPAGELSILAGSGAQGAVNGLGSSARFNYPYGIAVDASGNVYVADTSNHRIRKITPAGMVSTLAGSGSKGAVNGTGSSASFNEPYGIAVDASGNVYVADTGNSKIRKITPTGEVSTVAGIFARSVAVDAYGNVYVVDGSNTITKMDSNGGYSVTPQLPNGLTINPFTGVIGGTPTAVSAQTTYTVTATNRFGTVTATIDISVGPKPVIGYPTPTIYEVGTAITNLIPTSTGGSIVSFSIAPSLPTGLIIDTATGVISGTPTAVSIQTSYTVTATNNYGTATAVIAIGAKPFIGYTTPQNVVLGTAISLTPIITGGAVIYNLVSTLAGSGSPGASDAGGSSASFRRPCGVAVDASGNIYVADTDNSKIRKITPAGEVSTLAAGFYCYGIAVDASGNVYVTDGSNNRIRKITPAGVVSTFAGNGSYGAVDGSGIFANFNNPQGLAVDATGNVYVADSGNHKIRKITPSGVVSTLAGSGNGAVDGTGSSASFYNPQGVAVDGFGNVYVADTGNQKIRKITPAGVVVTLAGSGAYSAVDGAGNAASFKYPSGVALDASGNVYVADSGNQKIRQITPEGIVSTLAGSGTVGAVDGAGTLASFSSPYGISLDASGNIYVADSNNNKIRKITPSGYTVAPQFPTGVTINPTTGVIGGTPTVVLAETTYTVTATNSFGTATATIDISVGIKPVIGYATPQTYVVGTAITDLTPTSTGGSITSYSVSPNLPAGLIIDTATGIVGGTPTAVSASNTYTVTATNSFGAATATVVVEVKPASLAGTIAGATAVCSGANSVDLILSGNVGTIQWEASTDNWATYTAVGTNSTTFTVTNLVSTTSYRAVVTSGASPSAITSSVDVIVNPESVSGLIDGVAPVCSGTNSVNLILSGSTGTIQWQKSTNGVIFTDINGATSPNYTATDLTASYMAVVTSGVCPSASTAAITITVLPEVLAPTGDSQQTLSQGKKINDIVIQKDPNGVIEWYKTQADALANLNTLLPSDLIETGYYYAMQTIGGCRSTTPLEVDVTQTLGVNEFDTTKLRYYPNPVKDLLTISYDHEINSVKVFDILGQQIITVSPNSENANIDMAGLPMGNYLLQVNAQGKSTIIKVIKK